MLMMDNQLLAQRLMFTPVKAAVPRFPWPPTLPVSLFLKNFVPATIGVK